MHVCVVSSSQTRTYFRAINIGLVLIRGRMGGRVSTDYNAKMITNLHELTTLANANTEFNHFSNS